MRRLRTRLKKSTKSYANHQTQCCQRRQRWKIIAEATSLSAHGAPGAPWHVDLASLIGMGEINAHIRYR
jgi:hypothetical protein